MAMPDVHNANVGPGQIIRSRFAMHDGRGLDREQHTARKEFIGMRAAGMSQDGF
jgi:hypothetical protein